MTMREFKDLVRQVMTTLPPEIAAHTGNLVVDVADEPDDDFLRDKAGFIDEEIESGESLYGFFEPMDLLSYDGLDTDERPNRLWIFKNTHEDDFPDPRKMRIEVRKTVIHELAHHFGFDESDLERFDANPDPFKD